MVIEERLAKEALNDRLIAWLESYRSSHGIPEGRKLTDSELKQFVTDFQQEVLNQVGDNWGPISGTQDSTLVLYSGLDDWKQAKDFCGNSGGNYYYISDTLADPLWFDDLQYNVAWVIGEPIKTCPITKRVLSGKLPNGDRSQYALEGENLLAMDDFLSLQVAEYGIRNGNVVYVVGPKLNDTAVGMLTEIPAVINYARNNPDINITDRLTVYYNFQGIPGHYYLGNPIDISAADTYLGSQGEAVFLDVKELVGLGESSISEYAGVTSFSNYMILAEHYTPYEIGGVLGDSTSLLGANGELLGRIYGSSEIGILFPNHMPNSFRFAVKTSEYLAALKALGQPTISAELANATIYLDPASQRIGTSFEGTLLQNYFTSNTPSSYPINLSYTTYQSVFDCFSFEEMSLLYGPQFNSLSPKNQLDLQVEQGILISQFGEFVAYREIDVCIKYLIGSGKDYSNLNQLDRLILNSLTENPRDYTSELSDLNNLIQDGARFFASHPTLAKICKFGGDAVAAGVVAYSLKPYVEQTITNANTAFDEGRFYEGMETTAGAVANLGITFGVGSLTTAELMPYFAGIGFAVAGPAGALIGGILAGVGGYGVCGLLGQLTEWGLVEYGKYLDERYNLAGQSVRYVSDPLVLDLDGTGFDILSSINGVYFDEDAIGLAEKTGWIGRGDALLALDINEDGLINDGSELFGDSMSLPDGTKAQSGFEALQQYDSNGDGVIDQDDEFFDRLRIWNDKNHEGISLEDELYSTSDLGISSISLNYEDEDGINVSSVTYADGRKTKIGEFNFDAEYYNSIEKEEIIVSDEIMSLPDIAAMGRVSSLHTMMQNDETGRLMELIKQFSESESAMEKDALVTEILNFVTGANIVDSRSRGNEMDAKKLHVIEQFMGRDFVGTAGSNPVNTAAAILDDMYSKIHDMYYCSLNAQTQLQPYLRFVHWEEGSNGNRYLNTEIFDMYIKLCKEKGADEELPEVVGEMGRFISTFNSSNKDNLDRFLCEYLFDSSYARKIADYCNMSSIIGDDTDNEIIVAGDNAFIMGLDGADTISSGDGNEFIAGGSGEDIIRSGNGDDTIVGESGNDYLEGGRGNDTYIFNLGDGNDTIFDQEYDYNGGRADKIVFGEGISADDIVVDREGDNLKIQYSDEDSIIVQDVFNWNNRNGWNQIEQIEFNDSSIHRINYDTISLELIQSAVTEDAEEDVIVDQTELLTDTDEVSEDTETLAEVEEITDAEETVDVEEITDDTEALAEVVESAVESDETEDDTESMASLANEFMSEQEDEDSVISDESGIMDEIDNMVNLAIQDMSEDASCNVGDSDKLFDEASSSDYDQLWVVNE